MRKKNVRSEHVLKSALGPIYHRNTFNYPKIQQFFFQFFFQFFPLINIVQVTNRKLGKSVYEIQRKMNEWAEQSRAPMSNFAKK